MKTYRVLWKEYEVYDQLNSRDCFFKARKFHLQFQFYSYSYISSLSNLEISQVVSD
jgi:hypothetical protein